MIPRFLRLSRSFSSALALLLCTLGISATPLPAGDDACIAGGQPCRHCGKRHLRHCGPEAATLGYGPPGVYPGFQGFGLGYHLGYGYGGCALGVGADGGYPCYGGPGYPIGEPPLQRFGKIAPFPYYGGPGYPTPEQPNFYGSVGPLVADRPVVTTGVDYGAAGTYGNFTGTYPYPESTFASFTSAAATGTGSFGTRAPGTETGVPGGAYPAPPANTPGVEGAPSGTPDALSPAPPTGDAPTNLSAPPNMPAPGAPQTSAAPAPPRPLGIDAEPVVDAEGFHGMKVSKVDPGSPAEQGGLRPGDVIHSMNTYQTTKPDHFAWIIANAAPKRVVEMKVRSASDGKEHTLTAQLP
jgi:hypothetical protein